MKRIVFAVTNDLSYDQRMHRICATLQESGYFVTLIGRKRRHSIPLMEKSFEQRRLKCIFDKGPFFYAEYNLRLCVCLLRNTAEIFGACDLDTALAVMVAAKLKGRKTIFDAHEHFPEVPEVARRGVVRAVWHRIGKWCIPRSDIRYTVGECLANELQKEYKVPFAIVRNVPVLKDEQILPLSLREKLIVYQGALNEGRGLENAIDAMQLLPEFRLRLIGDGDLSTQLRRRVSDMHLDDRVEFTGYVRPEDINGYTRTAVIGLNLLEARSKSYYYSLANKFFDYMHAGIPSINMNFPEYRKIIDRCSVGICIAELSANAIAKAVGQMTGDANSLETMIKACVDARTEFRWEREKEVLLSLLRFEYKV